MGLLPLLLGDVQWLDLELLPPGDFIAGLVQLPVMPTAERNGELIAHFEA